MDSSCPDLNPAVRCNDHCMEIYTHCHFECDRETACEFECYADLDVCLRACPCFDDCPEGMKLKILFGCIQKKSRYTIFVILCLKNGLNLSALMARRFVKLFILGCKGCESDFCICAEPESNSDYVTCQKAAETEYHQCAFSCPIDDIHCISDCSRKYHEKYEKCPCQVSLIFITIYVT